MSELANQGIEQSRLDERISQFILETDRKNIWESAHRLLDSHVPNTSQCSLALGYVQSGKTTSMGALAAAAADRGFQIVVAFLGSTLLLLDQNRSRLESLLGLEEKNYAWVTLPNIRGKSSAKEIASYLSRPRFVFLPVIKNARQISKIKAALAELDLSGPTLIIDDEADQASLNTRPTKSTPSSTYDSIVALREAVPNHLYVQYTATPYAPLLLPPGDPLMPTAVEFLTPGTGYTGGREFFFTHERSAIRTIPLSDESTKTQIAELPPSLLTAFAAFLAGAAILSTTDEASPPISMLVHPTHRTDAHKRYVFLLQRLIRTLRLEGLKFRNFEDLLRREYKELVTHGATDMGEEEMLRVVLDVLRELQLSEVNSAAEVNNINWNFSKFHLLVGGNKLDRGFTVEGLTISYMNRKASEQLDTTEQRARAFGYRAQYLPFCQVHATSRTLRLLRGVVHTEDDLRANLRDWVEAGGQIDEWAREIGLNIPAGALPTRKNVIAALSKFNPDGSWHSLRRPSLAPNDLNFNAGLVTEFGLLDADSRTYGRIAHRSVECTLQEVLEKLVGPWIAPDDSPGWRHDEIVDFLERHPNKKRRTVVSLLAKEGAADLQPRERKWAVDTGFVNLFQGRDLPSVTSNRYEGDKEVGIDRKATDSVTIQVHFVRRRDHNEPGLYTLAAHLGDIQIVRKQGS